MPLQIFANESVIEYAQNLLDADVEFIQSKGVTVDIAVVHELEDFYIPSKATFILLNTDIDFGCKNFGDDKRYVITYGFNARATVTASSTVDDSRKMVCLQRSIKTLFGDEIEPQEFYVENLPEDLLLPCVILKLICA